MPQYSLAPTDPRLARLQEVRGLREPPPDIGQLLQQFASIYGINENMQTSPIRNANMQSETALHNAQAAELPITQHAIQSNAASENRLRDVQSSEFERTAKVRQMKEEADTLKDIYGGIVPEDVRNKFFDRYQLPRPTPPALPAGEAGPGDAKPTASPSRFATEPDAPGYFNLGGGIAKGVKDLPIETADLGRMMYEHLIVPPANLIGSVLGTPPLRTSGPITKYPSWDDLTPPNVKQIRKERQQ